MCDKICSKCGIEKNISEFRKNKNTKDGLRSECKECSKEINSNYYFNNKEKVKETNNKWLGKNLEKMKNYSVIYYKLNPEPNRKATKKWSTNNKDRVNENNKKYSKNRLLIDINFKNSCYIRSMINNSLRSLGFTKKSRTYEILGCSFEEFKIYIESKFEPWMSWENRGLYNGELNHGWDIDHIIPLSSATTEEEVIKLNHFSNLQPLCSYTNRYIKKDKIL